MTNREWPWEAVAFADAVRTLLDRLGAIDFARGAESNPLLRSTALRPELEKLGWFDLDPHETAADVIVAAAGAQAAGACVAPWPFAAQLALPRFLYPEFGGLYPVIDDVGRLEHLDVIPAAVAFDLRAERVTRVASVAKIERMPLDPFGVPCELGEDVTDLVPLDVWRRAVDLQIVIVAFYVLGALERSVMLSNEYAGQREQFGQPISNFGAIQWRIADLAVARYGLAELARYTLACVCNATATPADTLALRLATLEAAHVVLVNAHQIFGAVGLTEDCDLAVIDRHLQPLLRRPAGLTATSRLLRDAIRSHGFDGLFPIRARKPSRAPS